jgi:hypothetical protein
VSHDDYFKNFIAYRIAINHRAGISGIFRQTAAPAALYPYAHRHAGLVPQCALLDAEEKSELGQSRVRLWHGIFFYKQL